MFASSTSAEVDGLQSLTDASFHRRHLDKPVGRGTDVEQGFIFS